MNSETGGDCITEMTSSLPKRHNVNYKQKPFNPEKRSINDLKNKTQVNAAETTLEKLVAILIL